MSKKVLIESYHRFSRATKLNPVIPTDFKKTISNKNYWNVYVDSFAEGLGERDKDGFKQICENTRVSLLENSMFNTFQPYESLVVPILRRFYPRLIAKDITHVQPIDKPETILAFLRAYFGTHADVNGDGERIYPYQFPFVQEGRVSFDSTNNRYNFNSVVDVSRGTAVGVSTTAETGYDVHSVDLLASLGLTGVTSVEKDFRIIAVSDTSGDNPTWTNIPVVMADVDGNFSFQVTIGSNTDVVSGHVDFYTGTLVWSSAADVVKRLKFIAVLSLEDNKRNTKTKIVVEKLRFNVILRQISAEWTIPFEQDVKALYDIDAQAELVNLIGEQIAADIDREIIDDLIMTNNNNNPSTHIDVFYKKPPANFVGGPKLWMESVLVNLTKMAAVVYKDTLIGAANVVACNPITASVLENINDFRYDGSSTEGGDLGYAEGTLAGGKWKVYVSTNVPEETMLVLYRADELKKAVYVYAPYVPVLLTPFPLGSQPSITIMSRYAKRSIRPEGIGIVRVLDQQQP